jgi:hypothetical protein
MLPAKSRKYNFDEPTERHDGARCPRRDEFHRLVRHSAFRLRFVLDRNHFGARHSVGIVPPLLGLWRNRNDHPGHPLLVFHLETIGTIGGAAQATLSAANVEVLLACPPQRQAFGRPRCGVLA